MDSLKRLNLNIIILTIRIKKKKRIKYYLKKIKNEIKII